MAERENVIRGLEAHCKTWEKDSMAECLTNPDMCPYHQGMPGCTGVLAADALALLKEQEPRVLEYSEIEKNPLVWLEDEDKEDVIPGLFLQYNWGEAEFSVQDPDEYVESIVRAATVIAFEKTYNVRWRAWTAKPTQDQRLEVPWE